MRKQRVAFLNRHRAAPPLDSGPRHSPSQPGNARPRTFYWAAIGILMLGAVLRLAAFDETLIEPDQAAILDSAFQIAHLRYFPLTGMKSSVGVMQTGIVPLLAAIPLLVVKRIIAVQWFFSVLDLLALAWLHRAVRKTVGRRAACIAALLYATAPWVVLYARTIWYQTLIAGLATTAFASLLIVLSSSARRSRALPVAMVSITMLGMVHLAAAPWGGLLMALCLLVAWRRRMWRACLLGIVLSGLIGLPYLIHLVQSSFSELAFILATGRESSAANTAAYRLAGELVTGSMIVANAHGDLWDRSVFDWPSARPITLAILVAASVWALVTIATRPRRRSQLLLLVTWMVAVPTLFLRSDVHLQHFYLMTIFPAPFVLIGAWVEDCARPRLQPVRSALFGTTGRLVAGLMVLVALWWSSLWVVRIGLEAKGELQRDTRGWLMDQAADAVTAYLQGEPGGQVVVLDRFGGETSSFEWLRGYTQSSNVRVVPTGKGFVIPSGPTCYLLGPEVSPDTLWPASEDFAERPDLRIPANPFWPLYCGRSDARDRAVRARWNNGLSLLATAVSGDLTPGGQLQLTHTWEYRAIDPGPYHFYNHLLLDGTLVTQMDGGSVPHWHWRDGDILLTYFTLPLPADLQPGDYVLRVGMYTWPAMDRIRLTTGDDGYAAFTGIY